MEHIEIRAGAKTPRQTPAQFRSAIACVAIVVLALSGAAAAEAPYQIAWSRQIGTSRDDMGQSVAVDASGNAYISGYTSGSLGGPNAGLNDAFLGKYDSSGHLLWTRQTGTSDYDYSYSVGADGSGNAYISGTTYGGLAGPSAGMYDAILVKYDASGNLLWKRQIGTSDYDISYSVAVETSGNAYITGYTGGNFGGTNPGGGGAFLAKYDGAGNLLWTRQVGTSRSEASKSVAVDASGNAYVSGYTSGSFAGPNAGAQDAFLVKYDGSGNLIWSRQIGTSSLDESWSVAVDASGNAFISGYTDGSLGGTNAGSTDVFLTKYDGTGNLLWSRQVGSSSEDIARGVALDASGNAYISGWTWGTLGGTSAGGVDSFLGKYDGSGNLLWSQQIGTEADDDSYSVAVDASGNAYISGSSHGSLGGPNAGDWDTFLVKFTPEPASAMLFGLASVVLVAKRRGRRAHSE